MYTMQTTVHTTNSTVYTIVSAIMKGIDRSDREIIITNSKTGEVLFEYANKVIRWADIDFVIQALSEN